MTPRDKPSLWCRRWVYMHLECLIIAATLVHVILYHDFQQIFYLVLLTHDSFSNRCNSLTAGDHMTLFWCEIRHMVPIHGMHYITSAIIDQCESLHRFTAGGPSISNKKDSFSADKSSYFTFNTHQFMLKLEYFSFTMSDHQSHPFWLAVVHGYLWFLADIAWSCHMMSTSCSQSKAQPQTAGTADVC